MTGKGKLFKSDILCIALPAVLSANWAVHAVWTQVFLQHGCKPTCFRANGWSLLISADRSTIHPTCCGEFSPLITPALVSQLLPTVCKQHDDLPLADPLQRKNQMAASTNCIGSIAWSSAPAAVRPLGSLPPQAHPRAQRSWWRAPSSCWRVRYSTLWRPLRWFLYFLSRSSTKSFLWG